MFDVVRKLLSVYLNVYFKLILFFCYNAIIQWKCLASSRIYFPQWRRSICQWL